MARKIAAPKNTAGVGVEFENSVCAWLLAGMLSAEPTFEVELGPTIRVDFQTRVDGWLCDDALVTTEYRSTKHRVALSIKSNTQFTASSAPADFVQDAWEQWLGLEQKKVFQPAQDFMCLVTAPISSTAKQALNGLLEKIAIADPQTFASRVFTPGWSNEDERNMFTRFAKPSEVISPTPVDDVDTVRMVKRLRFLQHDFESITSESHKRSIKLCRACVRSHTLQDAEALWQLLIETATKFRPAGTITKEQLIASLRSRIALADYPDHVADWQKLSANSQRDAVLVGNSIADQIQLARTAAMVELASTIASHPLVALLGVSGAGKSAIARAFYEQQNLCENKALWFDAHSFECADFTTFEATLRLSNPLEQLFQATSSPQPILIIDGLDRLYVDNAFRNVTTMLRLVRAEHSPWRIVLPCQSAEWLRVKDALHRNGASNNQWELLQLLPLSAQDLIPVGEVLPAIARLLSQPKVCVSLTNLKLLDLVARRVMNGEVPEAATWVGESSVAEWFWQTEIDRGSDRIARGKFVRSLAQRQADRLLTAISTDEFDAAELRSLESLVADRICQQGTGDRLAFTHDLFGDWARLRVLLNNRDDLLQFFQKRRDSPLWHRSLRLFGIYLLEHEGKVDEWRAVLTSFEQSDFQVIHDIILEAPIFSANAGTLLKNVLPDLLANDGYLLRRLLTRFLVFGTAPKNDMVEIATILGDSKHAAQTMYREPFLPLWPDVILFLHANRTAVLAAAAAEISELLDMWLDFTSKKSILRNEAAEIAILLGQVALNTRHDYHQNESARQRFYSCALKVAKEQPDEVARQGNCMKPTGK